jgi:murein DD-endopeptidase MepM/ murein hydrolase activator NlpD
MKTALATLALLLTLTGCASPSPAVPTPEPPPATLVYPIADFPGRVTVKPFGIHITSATSPVQPERFSGYHCAADAETTLDEQATDTPVYAIADGTVVLARSADGYGGVLVLQVSIDGADYTAVYGHLNIDSFTVQVGDTVTVGQELALLGAPYSTETDGERKHLHFGLHPGTAIDIHGYVQSEAELENWLDPVAFFEARGL